MIKYLYASVRLYAETVTSFSIRISISVNGNV